MFYDDTDDNDRPLSPNEYPSPRDVYDSYVDDDEDGDLGWMYDKRWTTRRILITALLLLALFGFVLAGIIGVLQLLATPNAPPPTLPPLPRV
jgi:hypothetical protein